MAALDKALTLSVVVGMSIGIALVIVFASMPVSDGNSFSPESYYGWSPEDGGSPRIFLTEDVDGCCDKVAVLAFDHELKLNIEQNGH